MNISCRNHKWNVSSGEGEWGIEARRNGIKVGDKWDLHWAVYTKTIK